MCSSDTTSASSHSSALLFSPAYLTLYMTSPSSLVRESSTRLITFSSHRCRFGSGCALPPPSRRAFFPGGPAWRGHNLVVAYTAVRRAVLAPCSSTSPPSSSSATSTHSNLGQCPLTVEIPIYRGDHTLLDPTRIYQDSIKAPISYAQPILGLTPTDRGATVGDPLWAYPLPGFCDNY
jgi:hypothetical protein